MQKCFFTKHFLFITNFGKNTSLKKLFSIISSISIHVSYLTSDRDNQKFPEYFTSYQSGDITISQ